VPHLASCRFVAKQRPGANRPREGRWIATVIDESVQRDYLEILFPLTVDYTAQFLQFVFEPKIKVTGTGATEGGRSTFEIANVSRFDLTARADEVRIYYDDVDDGRSSFSPDCGVGTGEFTLTARTAGQEPDALECEMPAEFPAEAKAPKSRGNFMVVIRGKHGDRGLVVDPSVDWKDGDFVTAVDHVLGWQIAYHKAPGALGTDATSVHDVFLASFDLQAALDGEEVALVEENLTAPFREQLGLGDTNPVDFSSPSAEPNGSRLSFGGDQIADSGLIQFVEPSEFYVLDLTDPETFVQRVPPLDPVFDFVGGPLWNRFPGNDRIVYSGTETGDQADRRIVQLNPASGSSDLATETSLFTVSSAYDNEAAGVRSVTGQAQDVVLADIASGELTRRIDMGNLTFEDCIDPELCFFSDSDNHSQTAPDFSPAGDRLLFVEFGGVEAPFGHLFVADPGENTIAQLPGVSVQAANPRWSPDGEFIAFLALEDGRIHVVPESGGHPWRYRPADPA